MEIMAEKCDSLRQIIERKLGFPIRTPKVFELLSRQIYQKTNKILSMSTLKRFWGYVDKERTEKQVRLSTLDILSEYAGYQNWALFCQADITEGTDDSNKLVNRHLYVKELNIGVYIELRWKLNHRVLIRYEGENLFTVVESIHNMLQTGDTFHCSHIVEGMPLILFNLVRDGVIQGNFVCGKNYGIEFVKR